jgi:hypothetical protein
LGLEIHIINEKVEQPVNSSDPFCKSYSGLANRHSKREIMGDKFTWEEKVEQPVNSSDPFCKSYFGLAERHSKRDKGKGEAKSTPGKIWKGWWESR